MIHEVKEQQFWLEVADLEELPVGNGKTVRLNDTEIAIFRLEDGRVKAIENRCPHKNGVLAEGIVSGEYVFCPMHDRKISLASGLVQAPDTGCVRTYQAVVRDGKVLVAWSVTEHRLITEEAG